MVIGSARIKMQFSNYGGAERATSALGPLTDMPSPDLRGPLCLQQRILLVGDTEFLFSRPCECPLRHRHDLAGIENVLRIERLLQGARGVDRLWAQLGLEVFLLALPDAVLAGAGAAHRLRALDQAMHEVLAARHFLRIVDVADQRTVEIAVADMADDRRQQVEP